MKPPYSTGILPLGASGFPWRRLGSELPYLGPQEYLPPNPKRSGPTIPPAWGSILYTPAAAEEYTNAQAASDAGAPPVTRRNVNAGAPEEAWRAFRLGGLPIRKVRCFGYQVSALKEAFANTYCSVTPVQRARSVRRPLHRPTPFCKSGFCRSLKIFKKGIDIS